MTFSVCSTLDLEWLHLPKTPVTHWCNKVATCNNNQGAKSNTSGLIVHELRDDVIGWPVVPCCRLPPHETLTQQVVQESLINFDSSEMCSGGFSLRFDILTCQKMSVSKYEVKTHGAGSLNPFKSLTMAEQQSCASVKTCPSTWTRPCCPC